MQQLRLITDEIEPVIEGTYVDRLVALLSGDLDFHEQDSGYASHNMHSFPAKFPPQLPRVFIDTLTEPGDVVLDPMMGSGTTILEAQLSDRRAIGFDIDPLAVLLTKVKTAPLVGPEVVRAGHLVMKHASVAIAERRDELESNLATRWNEATYQFVQYWFTEETQIELVALVEEIERVANQDVRDFLKLVLSSIIITKSGGVSLALDLGHTRPHRAKVVLDRDGQVVLERDQSDVSAKRARYVTKMLRSALEEFARRLHQNAKSLLQPRPNSWGPALSFGDAQWLALPDASVDLIVTSPPYASNAIDYMRAHKFSLVWLGYPMDDLSDRRKDYIGGEAISDYNFTELPKRTAQIVQDIFTLDERKGLVLRRYYSEMTHVLRQMHRVLKPGKAALIVVGSSTMRGCDTETESCLAEIGETLGFEVPKIGIHHLDRNRRMMPAGATVDLESQIQQRMHEEYVIGFYRP